LHVFSINAAGMILSSWDEKPKYSGDHALTANMKLEFIRRGLVPGRVKEEEQAFYSAPASVIICRNKYSAVKRSLIIAIIPC
jgi:hypothetical protein